MNNALLTELRLFTKNKCWYLDILLTEYFLDMIACLRYEGITVVTSSFENSFF